MKVRKDYCLRKAFVLLLALLICSVRLAYAVGYETIVPNNCSLGFMGELVCDDVSEVGLSLPAEVKIVAGAAKARIMLDDVVVAETSDMETSEYWDAEPKTTFVRVHFKSPVSLPKGHVYKFVIPAGAFCNNADSSVLYGEISQTFDVPDRFVGKDSQLYDGCSLSSLQIGGFDFGKAEMEKVGDPKVNLYKGDELLASSSVSIVYHNTHVGAHSYVNFMFDKRIQLTEGTHYTLTFPKGGVCSTVCKEVVNDEIRINIMGAPDKAPSLGEENPSGIVVKECEIGYNCKAVIADVENPNFYLEEKVGVKEEAKAYIMCGNDVMATSSSISASGQSMNGHDATRIYMNFDAPVRLPKGKDYELVIPAGMVYSVADPSVVAGKLVGQFSVPDDFVGAPENANDFSDRLYDGCTLSSISDGYIGFGNIETVAAAEETSIFLYKNEVQVAEGTVDVGWDFGTGYMSFDFGKTIKLDTHAHYQLVLPAGVIHTTEREDIVNKEMRINIYGPKSGTGVEGVVSEAVSVSCRDGILYINNVQQGQLVEVFTLDGRLVQRCKALENSIDLPLPGKGCYVVRVGEMTMKGILN